MGACSSSSAGGTRRTRRRAPGPQVGIEPPDLTADEEALVDNRAGRHRYDRQIVDAGSRADHSAVRRARISARSKARLVIGRVAAMTQLLDRRDTPRERMGRARGDRPARRATRGAVDLRRSPRSRRGVAPATGQVPADGRNVIARAEQPVRRRDDPCRSRQRAGRVPSRVSGSAMPAPSPVFGIAGDRAAMGQPGQRLQRQRDDPRGAPACDSASNSTPHASCSNRESYSGACGGGKPAVAMTASLGGDARGGTAARPSRAGDGEVPRRSAIRTPRVRRLDGVADLESRRGSRSGPRCTASAGVDPALGLPAVAEVEDADDARLDVVSGQLRAHHAQCADVLVVAEDIVLADAEADRADIVSHAISALRPRTSPAREWRPGTCQTTSSAIEGGEGREVARAERIGGAAIARRVRVFVGHERWLPPRPRRRRRAGPRRSRAARAPGDPTRRGAADDVGRRRGRRRSSRTRGPQRRYPFSRSRGARRLVVCPASARPDRVVGEFVEPTPLAFGLRDQRADDWWATRNGTPRRRTARRRRPSPRRVALGRGGRHRVAVDGRASRSARP